MADTTKKLADQSFFVFVKDVNTGKVRRLAIPGDVQIGLKDNPAELQLLGRLSLSAGDYGVTPKNAGILQVSNNDTIVSVSTTVTPGSGRVSVFLPAAPRNGQLHFIKDMTGTAGSVPIDIIPAAGVQIDQFDSTTLTDPYGSIALYWFGDKWRILVAGVTASGGGAPTDATYVTLSGNSTLTKERRLNLSGTNLVMTDQGANASVIIDLSSILGGGAGTFTYATITVDQYGRITAASNGSSPPPAGASYITVTNEPALSGERALTAGTGIKLTDAGANSSITAAINDNVVATLSGSRFTGPVVATDGFSGSLQQLSTGISYLVAGPNITIATSSNGQVVVSSTATITGSSGSGADVSASYVTIGNTGSLPNERALTAGAGITITDGGPGSSITIAASGPGANASAPSAFHGITTSSVFWSNTGSWTAFTGAVNNFTDIVTQSVSRNGSDFTVTYSGFYYFHAGFNAYGNDAYVSLRLRQSGSNYVALRRSTYRTTPADQNLVVLDGIFSSTAGTKWVLEYVSSGTILAWTSSNPLFDGTNMVTGEVSVFLAATPSVPLFTMPIMAGTVVTNTAYSGSKQSMGAAFFNPTTVNTFPGSKRFVWRAIVDVLSTEPNMSASVDLYDINGIVAFPPGIITGSIMSSSSPTMVQIEADLTSKLQVVTGSGIFEARLWRTVSGSLTSSVTCRNARLDVEFS